MQTTETTADPIAAEPARKAEPAPEADARARARSYLDRWERHLARVALDGPASMRCGAGGHPPAG